MTCSLDDSDTKNRRVFCPPRTLSDTQAAPRPATPVSPGGEKMRSFWDAPRSVEIPTPGSRKQDHSKAYPSKITKSHSVIFCCT